LMCDWDWMVQRIADMHPLFEPGTKAAYMSYTFGWVIGEVVRRTDPRSRQFGTFIQEEICQPLNLDSLWVGHCQLKQRWYAPAVGGAVVRCGEVLGTPLGLTPSQPRGDRKLTSTPLS